MSESERLRNSPKYRAWKRAAERNGATVRGAKLLLDIPRHDGSILFAMVEADALDPEGKPYHKYLLLRGAAVVVVTVVENRDTRDRKFLMLRQRRIGSGSDSLEFPAGMLDSEVDDPAGTAVRELEEETGLRVGREALVALADRPLYSSSGLDDEAIHYYACHVALPDAEFRALDGERRGNAEEGEFIRLGLWDYPDALKVVDSLQVRLGFHLYFEKLRGGRQEP